nr:DUF3949 domain-containing protein [Neobacillus sp. Marseille-Q6967]
MDKVFWAFILGYVLLSIILVPFQYRYIEQLEKMRKANEKKGKSQGEMFEDMEFENQVLHANAQGNLLFILANILATILYKIKHRKK